ncbi:hypothetical protein MESS2_1440021 [Mesorhizobium metallidurans STM 2683]|uniref:Uncharacterized protein n=1 Tax=Mesorhizobium metallidurans STM 2683 TaxID=1297569 RepID=M5EJJ0_9HYPH|nr:hypothetical protein MESS2_1440021 [Mesorhizobium metallidurans STM 2683]
MHGLPFSSNSNALHGPPGAEKWHLAPVEMAWFGQSSAQICARIKDPARNGGRSLGDVALHVRNDRLVGWGWVPGRAGARLGGGNLSSDRELDGGGCAVSDTAIVHQLSDYITVQL